MDSSRGSSRDCSQLLISALHACSRLVFTHSHRGMQQVPQQRSMGALAACLSEQSTMKRLAAHQVSLAALTSDFRAMRCTRASLPLPGAEHSRAMPASSGSCSSCASGLDDPQTYLHKQAGNASPLGQCVQHTVSCPGRQTHSCLCSAYISQELSLLCQEQAALLHLSRLTHVCCHYCEKAAGMHLHKCMSCSTPLDNQPAEGMPNHDRQSWQRCHHMAQVCDVLRQAASLHACCTLATPLPPQRYRIAIIARCRKEWHEVFLHKEPRPTLSLLFLGCRMPACTGHSQRRMRKVHLPAPSCMERAVNKEQWRPLCTLLRQPLAWQVVLRHA